VLGWKHYGSKNEAYKIAYEKQALASRASEHGFCQVRELPGAQAAPYRLFVLRFLPRKKGFGFSQKDRKEAKESESKSSAKLV